MQKCFNGIFLIPFFIIPFSIFAQQSSVSPYSRLGFGDVQPQIYTRALGMGGANLALVEPLNINNSNPASYSSLGLTTFEVGLQFGLIEQKQLNPDVTLNNNISGIRYFSIGVPVKKWWGSAFGLQPYSFKGYSIATQRTGPEDILIYDQFSGNGGLSKVYWGNGFTVAEGLSIGVNATYIFGNLEEENNILWSNGFYASRIFENAKVNGLRFDFGARYVYEIDENRDFALGLTFANKTKLSTTVDHYAFVTSSNGVSIDTLDNINGYQSDLVLPNEFGLGFTYGRKTDKSINYAWAINGDVHFYQGSTFENFDGEMNLMDGLRFEVGALITPGLTFTKDNRLSYFELIEYRLGGFYENTPYSVGGTQLKDYGITIGFGLPIRARNLAPGEQKNTMVNIGAVLGRRGSLDNGLIQESYLNLYLGLTLNDKWFNKIKYR